LVDSLYLKLLTRRPTESERAAYTNYLRDGFDSRLRKSAAKWVRPHVPHPYVSWSNHLHPNATTIKLHQQEAARKGDPPTQRLDPDWRTRLEDVLWAMLNAPEFLFTP
jgi:hypothetical protein